MEGIRKMEQRQVKEPDSLLMRTLCQHGLSPVIMMVKSFYYATGVLINGWAS